MNSIGILLCSILLLGNTFAHPQEDEITDLPGLDYTINFRHFSGYFNVTEDRYFHYWFTETQNNVNTDPLLLWLNGGPGCSSVSGLLTENGPYYVNENGTGLYENPYSWNKNASVLFLESPACVGFSYDTNGTCKTNDTQVAALNYEALKQFHAKFPEYRFRDFYITGESYAGIYIPTLSVKIVEENDTYPINFKGFAIGNGLTSYMSNENSLMFFAKYHALLGPELWDDMVNFCCNGTESREACFFWPNIYPPCETVVLKAVSIIQYSGLNVYNLYKDCEGGNVTNSTQASRYAFDVMNLFYDDPSLVEPLLSVPCVDSGPEADYLNTPEVREALHIPPEVQDWEICSNEVNRHYGRNVINISNMLTTLHDAGIRGLLYNGDVDMACNFLGNKWDVEGLGFNVLEETKPWTANGQIAGYVKKFELLDFLTIRGSGHMVPEDKPLEALQMISAFINNVPY